MPTYNIVDWLSTIPSGATDQVASASCPPRKRRRLNRPPTPELSDSHSINVMASGLGESPNKRQLPPDIDEIEIETPRASHSRRSMRVHTPQSESSYSLQSSDRERGSQSGRISPKKHLYALRRNPQGIQFHDPSAFTNKPASLEALLDAINSINDGEGILAPSARESLALAAQLHWAEFKWVGRGASRDWHFSASGDRDKAGHTPSPDAVLDILAAATECNEYAHSEANWNLEVHQRILETALRPPGQAKFSNLINFMGSTTAPIIPDYALSSPSKKVDFCIYIDPRHDPTSEPPTAPSTSASAFSATATTSLIQSAVDRLQDRLPSNFVSHSEFPPLRGRPIAVSIETKKTGEGWEGATIQLSVWQNAHWAFLRQLVAEAASAEETLRPIAESESRGLLPDFLPGIIIQGHDWHFVVTTPEGQQIIFWQKWAIGSTSSTKGIYQIIYVLQLLRQWVYDTYWPWLRNLILNLTTDRNTRAESL